jgi:hypothetical protein
MMAWWGAGNLPHPSQLYAQIAQQLINAHGVGRDQVRLNCA